MESKELYRNLLGLNEPWTVERVHRDMTGGQVEVSVGRAKGARFPCPECGQDLAVYDHAAARTWRHLDSCQVMTSLHANPPSRGLSSAWSPASAPALGGRADKGHQYMTVVCDLEEALVRHTLLNGQS